MLTRMRKQSYVLVPTGLNSNPNKDLWLHMQFGFNSQSCEVDVTRWWVTDAQGAPINLSALSYADVQFIAQCMTEEFIFHSSIYYHDLEMNHYERVSNE